MILQVLFNLLLSLKLYLDFVVELEERFHCIERFFPRSIDIDLKHRFAKLRYFHSDSSWHVFDKIIDIFLQRQFANDKIKNSISIF